jgi:hypothetical protein
MPNSSGISDRAFSAAAALCVLAAGWLIGVSSGAIAQEAGSLNPSLNARWTFTGGALYVRSDAEVASTIKETGQGGRVDLSTLGADKDYVSPFFMLRYRANKRWRFEFSYQNLDLNGHRGASTEINFNDVTIPVGWDVRSDLKIHQYSASVGYAFYRMPNAELGALVGVHVLDASAGIRGSAYVNNVQVERSGTISEIVPAPTLGLYGTYAFNNRLAIEGSVQYLQASVGGYSGRLFIASAALNYWIKPNTALSLGYKHFDVDITYDDSSTRDTYNVQFGGPYATVSIAF